MAANLNLRTVQVLLRCVQSSGNRYRESAALREFRRHYEDIGTHMGGYVEFSDADKGKIRAILRSEGVDPETSPDAWKGLSRSEALALGHNEKLTSDPVMRRRVAIKALLPDAPLHVGDQPLFLPVGCHVDADFREIDVSRHDWIVVVENWEAFERIDRAAVQLSFPGNCPLIVWRGAAGSIRADAMLAWLKQLPHPVAAFVDYDPKGLVIAATLPRLDHVVSPDIAVLIDWLKKGMEDRYLTQVPTSKAFLDACTDPAIRSVWHAISSQGKALPQEHFCRNNISGEFDATS